MSKNKFGKVTKKAVVLLIASCIYAVGIALFLDPNNLAPGGVSGLSILLNRLTGIETGTLILLLNIPLLLIAWKKFGWRMVAGTLTTLCLVSAFTNIFERFEPITNDLFLAALGGGCSMAVGLGIVMKNGLTTGGTDIVVKLLRRKWPHLKTASLFLLVDLVIISLSLPVFRDFEKTMYALVSLMIMSWVMDLVLYGKDEAKLIYIISDKTEEIARTFLTDMSIGVTYLDGVGAYTKKRKQIIMCVMKKRIAPKAEEVVKLIDPSAFMIVSSANEIFGLGYKSYYEQRY